MFSAITITSPKQGFAFDAAASAGAYAVIEKIAGFGGAMVRASVQAVRGAQKSGRSPQPVRLARA